MTYYVQNQVSFTYYRETKRWSDEKCSAFVIILSFPQRCDVLALKASLVSVVHKIAKNSFGDHSQEVELSWSLWLQVTA